MVCYISWQPVFFPLLLLNWVCVLLLQHFELCWSLRPLLGRVCPSSLWSTPKVSIWCKEARASTRSVMPLSVSLVATAQHILWCFVKKKKIFFFFKKSLSPHVVFIVVLCPQQRNCHSHLNMTHERKEIAAYEFVFSVKWSQVTNVLADKPLFFYCSYWESHSSWSLSVYWQEVRRTHSLNVYEMLSGNISHWSGAGTQAAVT